MKEPSPHGSLAASLMDEVQQQQYTEGKHTLLPSGRQGGGLAAASVAAAPPAPTATTTSTTANPTGSMTPSTSPSRKPPAEGVAGRACWGIVSDLESRVQDAWWTTVFADNMYLKTDGDVVEDPEITREEIALLEADPAIQRIFLRGSCGTGSPESGSTSSAVLDLCCGQGRHLLHLLSKYPHLRLHGHDQSSFLISLARERKSKQNSAAQLPFTVGDCRSIPYPDASFDLVLIMGNSFGYFPDDRGDKTVLGEAFRVLKPGGQLVLDLTDGNYMRTNFAEKSWEWMDHGSFVCRERQLSKDGKRLTSREIITQTDRGVVRDQFYQERLYSRAEMYELLRRAGFAVGHADADNAPLITLGQEMSKRNEDLGMMAQRMLIRTERPLTEGTGPPAPFPSTAAAGASIAGPAATMLAPTLVRQLPRFAVLLGDPSKPCVGKLHNSWNPEDLETRRRLMDALYALGYAKEDIAFLDSHDQLYHDLTTNPPPFIFNLCDEGYLNDAGMELHVPAFLDMLRIPYSGAGPNCLAFCYDKGLVNRMAAAIGVPTPRETFYLGTSFSPGSAAQRDRLDALHHTMDREFGYPAFIKPIKGDNSLGITQRSIVHNVTELDAYIAELAAMEIRDVIVQEYLQGNEYSVGMVGNTEGGFHFFPIIEVNYAKILAHNLPPILGFESKWDPTSPYWTDIGYEAAQLPAPIVATLHARCALLWERFQCRDYARFDFRCDRGKGDGQDGLVGEIKLLEVNPNPGWCWDGKFAYMGKLEGLAYPQVLAMILEAAALRVRTAAAASTAGTVA